MYEQVEKYTLEDYQKIVEADPQHKYEYIDGYIRMMAGGSLAHAKIAARIIKSLGIALDGSDCDVYTSDAQVELSKSRKYYPDVSVTCDPRDWTQKHFISSPTVVFEILSPSTENIDRGEKLTAYQGHPPIQEIVYIDSRRCYVEHHHRVGPYHWDLHIYTSKDEIINLSSVDVLLTIDDIYARVQLEAEDVPPES